MSGLDELRIQLDQVDEEIVRLYQERMELCDQVGEYKIKSGKKVLDREREQEKLQDVGGKVVGDFQQKGIREVYTQLMSLSRKLQYQKQVEAGLVDEISFAEILELKREGACVVFQGAEGAFGQVAMQRFFGNECKHFSVVTFRQAMEAIADGLADYAVLPIENSAIGSVVETYDLLVEFDNYIVGEVILPITHTLAGLSGTKLEQIEEVYSKAEALMQTSKFLGSHPDWQQVSVTNTALAAQKILADNDHSKVAVCSVYAADVYGLEVLKENINDEAGNSTRFIVIANQKVFLKDATKISICFELSHESGSLYHLLSHFIYNDLNMTRIESRPIEGISWEYRFFVDFEGNMRESSVKNALRGLQEEAINLKVLGNYHGI